jgi:hypothetical protein
MGNCYQLSRVFGVVLLAAATLSACELGSRKQRNDSSKVDQVTTRAFDEFAFKDSEFIMTMFPVDIAESKADPQICIFEVNFFVPFLKDNSITEFIEQSTRSINTFAFARSDIERLTKGRTSLPADLKADNIDPIEILRNIFVGYGVQDPGSKCEIDTKDEKTDSRSSVCRVVAGARARLEQFWDRARQENLSAVGPVQPLFARTLDETSIEVLHSGEYALILGRIKALAAGHDIRSTNRRSPCDGRKFDFSSHRDRLLEIAKAFPEVRDLTPDLPTPSLP